MPVEFPSDKEADHNVCAKLANILRNEGSLGIGFGAIGQPDNADRSGRGRHAVALPGRDTPCLTFS